MQSLTCIREAEAGKEDSRRGKGREVRGRLMNVLSRQGWKGRHLDLLASVFALRAPPPSPAGSPPPNSSVILTLVLSCGHGPLSLSQAEALPLSLQCQFRVSPSHGHSSPTYRPHSWPMTPSWGSAWELFSRALDARGLSDLSTWGHLGSRPGMHLLLPPLDLPRLEDSVPTWLLPRWLPLSLLLSLPVCLCIIR